MSVKLKIIERLIRTKPLPGISIIEPDELPENIADWPQDWQEEFEERAAIMEYDGHLIREEAEQWAQTIVRAFYRRHRQDTGENYV